MAAPRKPTFFWQALLILLPVAVLAAIGWASLRQDKILAQHDAAERAQVIADDLAAQIWNELTAKAPSPLNPSNGSMFEVDPTGRLMFPPAVVSAPLPQPFDLAGLNAGQTRLWLRLQGADAGQQGSEAVNQAFRDFIGSRPPDRLAAAANYGLGVLLAQQGKNTEAAELFDRVAKKYPEAVGESGLPFQPLAQLKLLQLAARIPDDITWTNTNPVETFGSNVVFHLTLLTPELLKQAEMLPTPAGRSEAKKWQLLWQNYAVTRQLYAAARGHFFARANPARPSFPLLSISAKNGNQTAADENLLPETGGTVANISFPRLFWFATPNMLYVPKTPGRSTQGVPPIDVGYVVVNHTSGSNFGSNAIPGTTRYVVSGALDWNWLAIGFGDPETNRWFVCRSESELGFRLTELVAGKKQIPEYFGIGVEVAGRQIKAFAPDLHLWTYRYGGGGKSSGREVKVPLSALATNVLASAVQPDQLLKVNVYLTSPDKLYQRQRARTFWFGALVVVSAAAALIGLLTAWRAFRQQRRLSELKSNFVSSVSHELRAPIASVRLMAENLEREKVPEPQKQKEYFSFIVQECRRLSALIENVLDFSRIEQGRKQYEFVPTDVMALVRTTVKLMEPYATEKGINLILETSLRSSRGNEALTEGTFNSDKSRAGIQHSTFNTELEIDGRAIQQALVNLIDNAVKHSPKGETVTVGVEIQNEKFKMKNEGDSTILNSQPLGAAKRSEDGSAFGLSVSDHGPGIPPEEQEKIFERFYRRGSELRRETQGVGIGLSIVKHIVQAHGGKVRVESAVGQGSRFTIELPMQQ